MRTDTVRSADGTTIGYRELGRGPGLAVVHGSMSTGYHHLHLAEALADAFTVYLIDRRGRGLSGPYRPGDEPRTEVEDLTAVLAHTGTTKVFGLSSGAILALLAALAVPTVDGMVLMEPPLLADAAEARAVLDRFDRELAAGKVNAAMVTAMKGARLGPALFNHIPNRLLEPLIGLAMRAEAKKATAEYPAMADLAPTLHADFRAVADASGPLDRFAAVRAPVLLLGGAKSPSYLKDALARLAKVLPHHELVRMPGVGHDASWNTDRRGKPAVVAAEIRRFLTKP